MAHLKKLWQLDCLILTKVSNQIDWINFSDFLRQRRVGDGMANALKTLSAIKDYYNEAGRPR